MDIYFATMNQAKVQSIQKDLEPGGITVIQQWIELSEPRSSDVQEIAKNKIAEAYAKIQKPTIVLDAGFYIQALNGFPRAFVNFTLETIGLEGILRLVEGKSRNCEFRDCLAYMDNKLKEPRFFLSSVKGKLSEKPIGVMQNHLWSELGLIFIPEESNKTEAEMSHGEYMEWRKLSREKNSTGRQLYKWLSADANYPYLTA